MKLIALSTEQAPRISVPLRFFAVAPLFLALAALLLALDGGNPFTGMHTPALLAATHSITLGFISMVMLGALQQILPVVIGSSLHAPRLVAWVSHLSLIAGTLLLSFGFSGGRPVLLNLAWPLLGLAFATFTSAALSSLARAAAQNASRNAILLAILALLAAVVLGMQLTQGYATGQMIAPQFAAAHVSLALGGWVLLLIVGVSYQVVPMFQLTPSYPKWLTLGLAPAIFLTLLLQLVLSLFASAAGWAEFVAGNLFWPGAIIFAVATLKLQQQRRRSIPDATLAFFRLAMGSLLSVAVLAMAAQYFDYPERMQILGALLFVIGFALSLIFGMLYKIVPFLIWFHLFRGGSIHSIPNMKEIIPEPWMWRHVWLHALTLAAAVLSPWWNNAAWLFMLCLLLQSILLCYTLYSAIAIYRRTLNRLKQDK
ncbi:MAG TPA: hypothetical protein VMV48_10875 [Gallionellaceae bacterium]|nr:hypothetical protein [Gallionellaceae bacterium]